jgi:lipopolysaccharide transport system permease protein
LDLGYVDFARLNALQRASGFFVTRGKVEHERGSGLFLSSNSRGMPHPLGRGAFKISFSGVLSPKLGSDAVRVKPESQTYSLGAKKCLQMAKVRFIEISVADFDLNTGCQLVLALRDQTEIRCAPLIRNLGNKTEGSLLRNFELILYKSYADLRAEAERSYLGFIWWLLEPALYLGAFYVLFVLVLQRGSGPNFVPFFLCGAVVWKWFDSAVRGGSHAISANSGLFQQVYVPKYVFPVISICGSTARFLPVFLVYILFLLVYGMPAEVTWLAAPAVMLTELCLLASVAMLVGAITPFLPDLRVAIDNGMMVLFFLSGIFFDINATSERVRFYLFLNPMAVLIDEYRNVLLRGIWPNWHKLALVLGFSVIIGYLALRILGRLDRRYGKLRFL